MNGIESVMKGGISAILIAAGYVVLWCGIFCLVGSATGMAGEDIRSCGFFCVMMAAIQIGSGIAWYRFVKPTA
jgi:hypothetical protein